MHTYIHTLLSLLTQKKLEEKERLEDKPRWPYVDSDDGSRMDVDDPGEDLGVVVLVSGGTEVHFVQHIALSTA